MVFRRLTGDKGVGGARPPQIDDEALDLRLRRHFEDMTADDGAGDETADRILGRLAARPLPPQQRSKLAGWWPSALLTNDFAPAWPRLAALAAVAALGFALGSIDLARLQDRSVTTPLGISTMEGDYLGGILFDDDV